MKKDITEDVLIKYILEDADNDERQRVETWLQASDTHVRHFEQTKFLLDNSRKLAQSSPLTEKEAWERFKVKRDNYKPAIIKPLNSHTRWLQLVAALLVVTAGAWAMWYYEHSQSGTWVTLTANEHVITDTLPDGSVIHLNKHSQIRYSGRTVKLNGEAFFQVVHNARLPFNVLAGKVNIQDIGTAFNVNASKDGVEIIVESGVVRVSRQTSSIELKPKQMVRIQSGNNSLRVEMNNDLLYQYYRTNEFVADHTPLNKLVEVLNEAYGTNIKIEGSDLAKVPVTVTFKKEPLDKILQVLMLTTPEIHRVNRGDEIILTR